MPYFQVDGASVYDRLHAPKFHLLVFSDQEHGHEELRAQVEHDYGAWVDFLALRLDPHVAELFGSDRSFTLLLRPDIHIAYLSPDASFEDLKAYFQRVIGYS